MSELPLEPPLWLTQTKLVPPRLRDDYIPRARLLSLLGASVTDHSLTLVSAPAGYGKTTLLADLPSACPHLPMAWLALGEEDNDFSHFCLGLAAALQGLAPGIGHKAQTLLTALDSQPALDPAEQPRRVMALFINDIVTALPAPFVLVLDDLHIVTEPLVYAALDYLLERLPPAMRLAVTTRHDPPLALARLRARGQLAELRLADLRFTTAEAAAFLNERLHLALSTVELDNLHTRTEGWAAGLRLLAGSLARLNQPGDRAAFIDRLAHTDRYLFDFLAEEVLRRQEPALRAFLLETSILAELTPALCQTVTGRDDAAALMEELYRRNLFLVAVDDLLTPVYRYHALFAEFLQQQLAREAPVRLTELHCRAASASTAPRQVIGHYLAAGLWLEAATVIEQVGEQFLDQGAFDTLRGWLAALPAEIIAGRPQLNYLQGIDAWRRWELNRGQSHIEQALAGFEANGNRVGAGEARVQLARILALKADLMGATAIIEQALNYPISAYSRARLLIIRSTVQLSMGNWPQVVDDIEAAVSLAERDSDPRILHALNENSIWGPFTVLPGGIARAERLTRLIERQGDSAPLPLQATAKHLRSLIWLWQGNWPPAIEAAEEAIAISERFGGGIWMSAAIGTLAPMCYALRGQTEKADAAFERHYRRLSQPDMDNYGPTFLTVFFFWLGRIRWQQNRLDEARAAYSQLESLAGPAEWPFAPGLRAMLAALLALSEGRAEQAETLLQQAVAIQNRLRFTMMFSNAHVLLAYLHWHEGRQQAALAEFSPVLAEYETENFPGLLMWEGDRLVAPLLQLARQADVHSGFCARTLRLMGIEPAAATEPKPGAGLLIPDTGETLTAREIEILRYLATGASNPLIAEQLFVSPHTVKRHVANIFTKLNVSTRTEATLRARDLGLL
ncbi:MAG: HTH-type transcriptional regulator MalT [Anaerolineae bacterium]|nr:HTH-type transcriptional regulator MalT [Anaerolineae bacterium]